MGWPYYFVFLQQVQEQLPKVKSLTSSDKKHISRGILQSYIKYLIDVKFASGIKNINFGFYPYTPMC